MCSTGTCWWSSERDDRNMREMTRKNRSLHGSSDPELRFCSRFCRIVRIGTNRIVAWLSRARDNCLVVAIGTLARYRAFSRSRSGAVGHNAVATRVPGRVVGPGSQISNAKARLSLQQHANAEKTLTKHNDVMRAARVAFRAHGHARIPLIHVMLSQEAELSNSQPL
jgi:hypothetical protein